MQRPTANSENTAECKLHQAQRVHHVRHSYHSASFSLQRLDLPFSWCPRCLPFSIMSASKAQSQKIFEKLKLKPANKVRTTPPPVRSLAAIWPLFANEILAGRYASTAALRTRLGRRSRLVSTYALIVRPTIAILVSTSPLFDPQILTVRIFGTPSLEDDTTGNTRLMGFFRMAMGSTASDEGRW